MRDSDHTRISDFQIVDQWGNFTTLDQRRFYLRRLVRVLSDDMISASEYHPGGYDRHTSNLFHVNQEAMEEVRAHQTDVLSKVWGLPDNIIFHSPEWEILQQVITPMSREFKIHLQPQEDHIPEVVSRLVALIMTDEFLAQSIACFKCRVIFQSQQPPDNRAIIIIYLTLEKKRQAARNMCRQVLAKLSNGLADCECFSNGILPIWNYPVNDLISFIQIGTDTKLHLVKILGERRFNLLFPEKFYRALLMDEKIEYYL